MLLGLMLILFPLQIVSQETDIGKVVTENAVSYTHLTLPTNLSV